MARQDIHRKHILVAGDYRYVDHIDLDVAAAVEDAHLLAGPDMLALQRHISQQRERLAVIRARMVGDNTSLGQCSVCGVAIRYAVIWEHIPSGGLISSGEDCAESIDSAIMAGLANEAGAMRKFAVTMREAIKVAADRAAWLAADPKNAEAAEYVEANQQGDEFLSSLAGALTRYGCLTERQVVAAINSKVRSAERAAAAAERAAKGAGSHLGTVGQKLTVKVTVAFTKYVQTRFGGSTLVIMETVDGDKLKTFAAGAFGEVEKGQNLTVTGTVKSHDTYQGENATMLTRCKAV